MVCLPLLSSYSAVQTFSNLHSNRKKRSFWSDAFHIAVFFVCWLVGFLGSCCFHFPLSGIVSAGAAWLPLEEMH